MKLPKPPSKGEAALALQLKALGIPFDREVIFAPPRRWRFDFVLPGKWAVEVDGGIYSKGRHSRPKGILGDMEKANAATALGYRLLRFSTSQVTSGQAIAQIKKLLTPAS